MVGERKHIVNQPIHGLEPKIGDLLLKLKGLSQPSGYAKYTVLHEPVQKLDTEGYADRGSLFLQVDMLVMWTAGTYTLC